MRIDVTIAGDKIKATRSRAHLLLAKLAERQNHGNLADSNLKMAWRLAPSGDVETALRYGNNALRNGDTNDAIEAFTRAVEAESENAQALYKLGFSFERAKEWKSADLAYEQGQVVQPNAGNIAFRRGRCLTELGFIDDAVLQYGIAIRSSYRVADSYLAVYEAEKTAPLWKRLETLREGTGHHLDNAKWLCDRAAIAAKMGYYSEAVEYFVASDQLTSLKHNHRVDLARCHQELGHTAKAAELLQDLATADKGPAKTLGPGVYFRNRGYWLEAISLFKWTLNRTYSVNGQAALEFEIGHAHDRQYNWIEARKWFQKSLLTDGSQAYRHYRLGAVLERLGQFEEAIGPYARALQLDPSKKHWFYRLGVSARRAGNDSAALGALLLSIGSQLPLENAGDVSDSEGRVPALSVFADEFVRGLGSDYAAELDGRRRSWCPVRVETWYESLDRARSDSDRSAELAALVELSRRESHVTYSDVSEYVKLLLGEGSINEALDVLEATRDVRFPDGLDLKKYLSNPGSRRRSLFAEYQETIRLKDSYVFFESNHGDSIGCHPLALFREMSQDARFEGFTYIWASTSNASIPDELSSRTDVILVNMHSDLYLKYLASAKYLVNNVSFAPYFVRRPLQVYLNTWHGTPLKSLGKSMRQGELEYENLARNFVQATHVTSPNALTDWALFDDHRISRYASASRRITGSPRLDRLVNSAEALREEVRGNLGISTDENVILYAPTWRGGVSEHEFDTEQLIDDLNAMCGVPNGRVLFRAHRLTEKLVSGLSLPANVVPADIDTNDLLAAVDILVTDYSSIAFDFLPTRRPMVFYTPDIESYTRNRGLYLSVEELPGMVCSSRDALVSALHDATTLSEAEYDSMIARFAPQEDGNASRRTIDFLLEPKEPAVRERPLIVIHASLIPNGIASALLALLHALDPDEADIVLVIEAHVIRREEGRRHILGRIPDHVDLAFRVGDLTATPEELWAIRRDDSHDTSNTEAIKSLKKRAWKREACRVLGHAQVHTAIEFDGYATLWADLISQVGGAGTRHLIWQHNQLVNEWRTKYPELGALFRRYSEFDAIVPVADSLARENERSLSEAGFGNQTKYLAVPNVVDVDRILKSANKLLDEDLREWFAPEFNHVVAIGRLSPEKNFRALVDAWPNVVAAKPNARLTIVGSGLLEAELKGRADELGVASSVKFAGQRSNPLPILKLADLFVLPSIHEGQPVVLLEAMTLGRPVAAAYTPGSAELIDEGYGRVIDHQAQGMADDIVRILQNPEIASGEFDTAEFRRRALELFRDNAVEY